MNSFRKIEMFFNEKGEQIDSGGKVVKNSGLVRLIYDETVIICAKFMQVDSSEAIPETNAVQLNPHAAFSCFGDTGYQSESLLFLAQNNPDDPDDNCVNLPGDWLDNNTANPENGELSFRITTGNINFADALTGKQSRICQMVITATPPGCTECSVLALCQFYAYNRPSLQDFPPQQLSRDFLDANQIAALLAATVALPLAGCFGLPGPDEIASQAEDFASQAQELADTLSDVDWGKVSRLVVRDAQTGEVVRELTDQDQIEGAFDPLSDENGLAAEPDADAEYAFELWQPETQKLGQDAADLDEVKVLEVTTYEGSPVVELEVSPIGLRLHLTSRAAADSLRALAG